MGQRMRTLGFAALIALSVLLTALQFLVELVRLQLRDQIFEDMIGELFPLYEQIPRDAHVVACHPGRRETATALGLYYAWPHTQVQVLNDPHCRAPADAYWFSIADAPTPAAFESSRPLIARSPNFELRGPLPRSGDSGGR